MTRYEYSRVNAAADVHSEVTERSCHRRFGGWKVLGAAWALRGPCRGGGGSSSLWGERLELGGCQGFEAEGLESGFFSGCVSVCLSHPCCDACVGVEVFTGVLGVFTGGK